MKKVTLLSGVFLLAVILMSWTYSNNDAPSSNAADGYGIGDVAADFSLKNIDGKMVSLADYKDVNGYIVVFTCNHCPYAVMYEDRLNALQAKYASQGYPIVAINPNDPEVKPADSFENMQVRAKEKGFEFAYLMDEGQKVYPQYGATKTPHVFLLDKNRVVKYIGAIDDNARSADSVEETFLEDAIVSLQMGEEVNPATTKAVGCSIKKKG
ncbi:thioredoxin family protein [Saprospiraceae bacterium]|nr:thioredoxin family protein [Saprospiraceae bacterium]